MLTVKQLINRIRANTSDKLETGYTDEDLLGYINDGIRFIRRQIMNTLPDLITEHITGTIPANESEITLDTMFLKIIELRINDKVIIPVFRGGKAAEYGEPEVYSITGFNSLNIFPVPDHDCEYSLVYVKDMELIDIEGQSPFPTDIDDFIIEYATIRASIRNEFDISQEAQIMGQLVGQIQTVINHIYPMEVLGEYYWNQKDKSAGGGYW